MFKAKNKVILSFLFLGFLGYSNTIFCNNQNAIDRFVAVSKLKNQKKVINPVVESCLYILGTLSIKACVWLLPENIKQNLLV